MTPEQLIDKLSKVEPLIVDIGCGINKLKGAIGIDKLDIENVDIVSDVVNGLKFFPTSSVSLLNARSILEHVDDLKELMDEAWRILKVDGIFNIFVPHFSNPYFYSDYTHTKFMGLYTFLYFCVKGPFKRKVPMFYGDKKFELLHIKIVFDSPFYFRRKYKKIFEVLFNINPFMQEFYEENLTYIFPCYGLEVKLRPSKM